ncbi:hypothetical protein ACFHW2_42945 [Actinomadura sp. LOL_016]|uniref:hypothetical protein n=1 Tax=unclassified Actinomadura TaxID=2626254 RepID=UPI003A80209A
MALVLSVRWKSSSQEANAQLEVDLVQQPGFGHEGPGVVLPRTVLPRLGDLGLASVLRPADQLQFLRETRVLADPSVSKDTPVTLAQVSDRSVTPKSPPAVTA